MRSVWISGLPSSNQEEMATKIFGGITPDTLVILQDDTTVLDKVPMEYIIKVGASKGMRFAHFVREEFFPKWLSYLDFTIIQIDSPRDFTNSDDFNQAVQDFWFNRGKLIVQVQVNGKDDLNMTELLYSYSPNDLDFWVDLRQVRSIKVLSELREIFLTRPFSTVRVVTP